jgi:ATP-dependent RNA helicase DeaD
MTEFEGIVPALGQALSKRGYSELTAVQKAVLTSEVVGSDALVSAQTGSGKTVAFGLALAPDLMNGSDRFGRADAPLALIIAPTRELALQVTRELEWLYELTGAVVTSCVGGMDMRSERRELGRGVHIVVGTPGRLRDHIERKSLNTAALKAVVLDEADEMLDLGFREDLEFILEATPVERRTMMFSATVPRGIANLAKQYQRNAVRIAASGEARQHVDIEYRALMVASQDRENAIVNVLRYFEAATALVFCATRATVNHMTARFNNRGFAVVALSGELSQSERTHALQAMRDGRARVCIATDVAARGIDLPNLELVVHADLPTNAETLLHRSGRTGRAGRKGVSVLIVPHNARRRAEQLLQRAGINANWAKPPSADEVIKRDEERLLADPVLSEPLKGEEPRLVSELLERHGAEQVAAAFLRRYRAGQSAPEELLDISPPPERRGKSNDTKQRESKPRESKHREDFGESVWFSISVGRKQNAEPRWLLPLICQGGGLTKKDIGAIRIQNTETHVQIAVDSVDQFVAAIGPNQKLEDTIRVKRLNGAPPAASDFQGRPDKDRKPDERSKPSREWKSGAGTAAKPKRSYGPKFAGQLANEHAGTGPRKRKSKKPNDAKLGKAKSRTGDQAA